MLTSLRLRLRRLLFRRRLEQDLAEEMRFHLEMSAAEHARAGASPDEARRLARLEFGGTDKYGEAYRDVSGTRLLEDVALDVRYAVRSLRRAPAFTAAALFILALGMAGATAMFSLVDAVLLRPLPFDDADRLVRVWQTDRHSGTTREAASIPDYFDYVERARFLETVAAHTLQFRNYAAGDRAERISVLAATHTLLPMLGAHVQLGRAFSADEDVRGAAPVAVVSDAFWRSRLGGDPNAVGQRIVIDDVAHVVLGVLAHGREFPDAGTDVWVPLRASATGSSRHLHDVHVTARLAAGTTTAAAQRNMDVLMAELEAEYPEENDGRGAYVEPLRDVLVGNARTPVLILGAGVLLLLITACANVANLLLARAVARDTEIAVRSALGAARSRLVSQLVTESLVLTLAAGACAAVLAAVAIDLVADTVGALVPLVQHARLDLRVFVFTLFVCTFTGVIFGLLPARRLRHDLASTLRIDGVRTVAGGTRMRRVLVTAQIALSVLLLISAGLLLRSLAEVVRVDAGFTANGVVKAEFQLPSARYATSYDNYPDWPEVQRFMTAAEASLAAIPGVTAAAVAAQHPLEAGFTTSFVIAGRENEAATQPEIFVRAISPGYAEVVGLRVIAGRSFDERDNAGGAPVLLLNRAAAERYFNGRDAVGQRIRFWGSSREIVGVIADERFDGLARNAPPAAYSPISQTPVTGGSLLVRTGRDPRRLSGDIRSAIRSVDPQLALFAVEPLTQTMRHALARERITAVLIALFAGTALLLTSIGVHGLIAYMFVQRSREIGIRSALGAAPRSLELLFLKEGMRMAAAGILAGVLCAAVVATALRPLLFAVGAHDARTYIGAVALMLAVTLFACWVPARRAGRTSPIGVMRP